MPRAKTIKLEQARFLRMYCKSYYDTWLASLNDTQWRIYWELHMICHDNSDDGRMAFSWHNLTRLLRRPNHNMTIVKAVVRFDEGERIVIENKPEFLGPIPQDIRAKIPLFPPGVHPVETGRDRGGGWVKARSIRREIKLFFPKLLELYGAKVYQKGDIDTLKILPKGNTDNMSPFGTESKPSFKYVLNEKTGEYDRVPAAEKELRESIDD